MGLNEQELLRKRVEEKITTLFIVSMADAMQYFVKDIKCTNGGIIVGKRLEYAVNRINHFAEAIVLDLSKRYGEEVVEDFAHDADLMRQTMRVFMDDLIEGVMKRYDREDFK